MLPGHLLVPGALQVLGTDRKKRLPGDTRSLWEGWDVVAAGLPSEPTECQGLPSFPSKTALPHLWPGCPILTALPLCPTQHCWRVGWEAEPMCPTQGK